MNLHKQLVLIFHTCCYSYMLFGNTFASQTYLEKMRVTDSVSESVMVIHMTWLRWLWRVRIMMTAMTNDGHKDPKEDGDEFVAICALLGQLLRPYICGGGNAIDFNGLGDPPPPPPSAWLLNKGFQIGIGIYKFFYGELGSYSCENALLPQQAQLKPNSATDIYHKYGEISIAIVHRYWSQIWGNVCHNRAGIYPSQLWGKPQNMKNPPP